jgi:hypothetical protein
MATRSPQEVFGHHAQALGNENLDDQTVRSTPCSPPADGTAGRRDRVAGRSL